MADDGDKERKRAAIWISAVLRQRMGTDEDGNLRADMYALFKEKLVAPDAKADFQQKIINLKAKLESLGISADNVADPMLVLVVVVVVVVVVIRPRRPHNGVDVG